MVSRKSPVIIVWLLVLASCTSPHAVPAAPTPIPRLIVATLPVAEAAAAQPAPGTDAPTGGTDTAAGETVFAGSCAVCHNLIDQPKVGPGLKGLFDKSTLPDGQAFSEEALRQWILNGGGAMPGIPLAASQMDDLIAYLRQATE